MINGDKVYLCSIEREDLEQLRVWRNRSDYRMFFREYREINQDMQKNGIKQKLLVIRLQSCLRFVSSAITN
jgi:hypothetical protein